ncbi:MAG: hypothetical protein JST16_08215 [Bdellovibrionales bacterium]|nr:hypothetical protein [Bdellovibrionales bacterium]
MGNFLLLPSAVLYEGGLRVLLLHVLSLLLLGAPLVVAEMLWGRWLQRSYSRSFRAVIPWLSWAPMLGVGACMLIAPGYFVALGRLCMFGLEVLARGGYPGPTLRSHVDTSSLWSFAGAALVVTLAALISLGTSRRLVASARLLLGFALPAWLFLSIWTLSTWGNQGLLKILYWGAQPLSLDVALKVASFSLFSLSAGFGVLYTYVYYASQVPAHGGEDFWRRQGSLVKVVGWVVAGDLFASLASLVIVSPYGITSAGKNFEVRSSLVLMLDWVPEILISAQGGGALVLLHLLALMAAGLAAAISLFEWASFQLESDFHWNRRRAVLNTWILALCLSALPLLPKLGAEMEHWGSDWFLPLSALVISWVVGWKMPVRAQRQIFGRGLLLDNWFRLWRFSIRYLTPCFLLYLMFRRAFAAG